MQSYPFINIDEVNKAIELTRFNVSSYKNDNHNDYF